MNLYLLQQAGPVNFTEPHGVCPLTLPSGYNPGTLRLYASKLGITSRHNYTDKILRSTPLPPYYLNMLAKDCEVQRWIVSHYPHLTPLIIELTHPIAILEDTARSLAKLRTLTKAAQAKRKLEAAQVAATRHNAREARRSASHKAKIAQGPREQTLLDTGTYTEVVHGILAKIRDHSMAYTDNQYAAMQRQTVKVDGVGATLGTIRTIASRYRTALTADDTVALDEHKVRAYYEETGSIQATARHFNTTRSKIIHIL